MCVRKFDRIAENDCTIALQVSHLVWVVRRRKENDDCVQIIAIKNKEYIQEKRGVCIHLTQPVFIVIDFCFGFLVFCFAADTQNV